MGHSIPHPTALKVNFCIYLYVPNGQHTCTHAHTFEHIYLYVRVWHSGNSPLEHIYRVKIAGVIGN